MASILPNQIPPESVEILAPDGKHIAHNWWLWAYNISQAVLGNQSSTAAAFAAQLIADLDADADSTDALTLFQRVANLEKQVTEEYLPKPAALMFDELLPDPIPRAQPVQVIAVGGSPFTYTAGFDGTVIITGGTVSALALSRDGSTFYDVTGAITIPVSRLDQVRVTHSGAPTMTFFPR